MLDPDGLADVFSLGRPRRRLVPVAGAWFNRLWRLETERGRFAVKELCGPPGAGGWAGRLREAMAVERAAVAAGTIPMAAPLAAPGGSGRPALGGGDLAGLTPLVERLAGRLDTLRGQGRALRWSHRDLDPKNAVVRGDARVALLDWDHAGPTLAAGDARPDRPAAGPASGPRLIGSFAADAAAVDHWAGRVAQAMWMI